MTGCRRRRLLDHVVGLAGVVEGHEPVGDDLLDLLMVPGAGGQGGELGIGLEVGAAHAVAQRVPGAGGDGADDHGHGLTGVDAVGGHVGVVVAGAVLDVALLVVILQGVVDVDKVAHEGEIDELALAGPLLVEEAIITAAKKPSAPIMSPMTEPMRVGLPSRSPVWAFRPDMATAQMS